MHNRAVRAGHGESPTTRSLRAQECALLCCRWWCTSTPPPPPTLCVAPIFTYLASVFCTVRTPAHNATHHPINRHWLVNQLSSSWRSEKGRNLLDLPFYYSWLCACCIISLLLLHFLLFSHSPIILFTHSFTDFNGQEDMPALASYVHPFSPQCSHSLVASENFLNIPLGPNIVKQSW